MGTIIISKKESQKYKFSYNNRKGNTIFVSKGFDTKEDCLKGIEFVINSFDSIEYSNHKSTSGKIFFKVEINQELQGQSRKFTTPLLSDKGLTDFKDNFTQSEILDLTVNIFETLNTN